MIGENKKTILLVEDELITAGALEKTLLKYGYKVITAYSGESAFDLFNSDKNIDLILMDIDLGDGPDGTVTAVKMLKERMVPIIFLSNHIEPEIVEKTEQITSYGYVIKNSGITVLNASIKMAFKLFESNEKMRIAEETYRCKSEELEEANEELNAAMEEMEATNEELTDTGGKLAAAYDALRESEKAYKESEFKYRSLIENSTDVVFCVDRNGEYKFVNQVFASTFGKTPDYFSGKTFWDIYPKEHADFRQAASTRVFETGESQSVEVVVPLPETTLYFIAKANPIRDETGKVILNITHATDITERKLAEEKVKDLLAEKELILKEVHHRIKNNMNTIKSLLSLQGDTLKDPSAINALEDAGSRINSMMVLYDKLYQSADFTDMPVKNYIPSLVDEIVANFPNNKLVRVEKKIDDFVLDVKRIQLLGIIINELLTNIMKYAVKGRSDALIKLTAGIIDNHVSITIQDNGGGMPESVTFENSTGFGLQLVDMMTKQLGGTIRIERENGTKIFLEFDI